MPFSTIAVNRENYIQTSATQFQCLVGLCLYFYQVEPAILRIAAADPRAQPVFRPICVQTERVLQNCRYPETLLIGLTPLGPVPLPDPCPQWIPCGRMEVTAYPVAGPLQLAIVFSIIGIFTYETSGGRVTVSAAAPPMARFFPVESPQKGSWEIQATVTCYQCWAIRAAESKTTPDHSDRFSHAVRLLDNQVKSASPSRRYRHILVRNRRRQAKVDLGLAVSRK